MIDAQRSMISVLTILALALGGAGCGRLQFGLDAAAPELPSLDSGPDDATVSTDGATLDASGNDAGTFPLGALQIHPTDPLRFRYAGSPGTAFFCGISEPEDFFHRGTRNADGTRSGDQDEIIDRMLATGMNVLTAVIVKSHGGEGTADDNPFVDSDAARGSSTPVLDQWAGWLDRLNRGGVVTILYVYDGGACAFDCGSPTVPPEEEAFIDALVDRLGRFPLIAWGVTQVGFGSLGRERISNIAARLRAADGLGHPVGTHTFSPRVDFPTDFGDDPDIEVRFFGAGSGPATLHDVVARHFATSAGRYALVLDDTTADFSDPGIHNWAAALGGAHPQIDDWRTDVLAAPMRVQRDCGLLADFLGRVDLSGTAPRDDLAAGGTEHVLAAPSRDEYIAYSSSVGADLGVRSVAAGSYDVTTLDIANQTESTSVMSFAGGLLTVPTSVAAGAPVAVWIRRSR